MNIESIRTTAWSWFIALWTLACEHQAITAYVVGSVLAFLLKPQSEEHYAAIASKRPVWFFSRWAAFRQFLPTQFNDTGKAVSIVLAKIFAGPPKPPAPPGPPIGRSLVPSSDPPPPSVPKSAARLMLATLVLSLLVATPGCSLLTKRTAKTVLDAAALACVFQSEVTDESAVADACDIARELIPIVRNLIGQREAAKRSGVRWSSTAADAGATDAQ